MHSLNVSNDEKALLFLGASVVTSALTKRLTRACTTACSGSRFGVQMKTETGSASASMLCAGEESMQCDIWWCLLSTWTVEWLSAHWMIGSRLAFGQQLQKWNKCNKMSCYRPFSLAVEWFNCLTWRKTCKNHWSKSSWRGSLKSTLFKLELMLALTKWSCCCGNRVSYRQLATNTLSLSLDICWTITPKLQASCSKLGQTQSRHSMTSMNAGVASDLSNRTDNSLMFHSIKDTIDPETGFDLLSNKTLPSHIAQVSSFGKAQISIHRRQFRKMGLNVNNHVVETKVKRNSFSASMAEVMGNTTRNSILFHF